MREASRRQCDVQEASCVNVMCKDAVADDVAADVSSAVTIAGCCS